MSEATSCTEPEQNAHLCGAAALILPFVAVLALGIEKGILSGAASTIILHLWRTNRPHLAVVGRIANTEHFRNVLRYETETLPHVLMLRIDESLYFANAMHIEDFVLCAAAERPQLRHLVLICSAINFIDASALETLTSLVIRLRDAGIQLHLTEVKGPVMDRLARTDLSRTARPRTSLPYDSGGLREARVRLAHAAPNSVEPGTGFVTSTERTKKPNQAMKNNTKLTILQINDTHGYLEPHPELFWQGNKAEYRSAGGYARLLTIFKQVRLERNGAVIALDNGDTFHGTFHAVQSEGEALIEPVNLLGLDAWTAHWDFAYGPDRMRYLAAKLKHPLLASNCYQLDTGELAYPAFTVIERGGVRVGIIGIAATIIDKTMPEHFSTGLRFTLGNEELPGHIRTLREREGVDLVVVLSHLGFPQDMKLASEVAGIDILLSGHTHNRMDAPLRVNGATIIQSGCHGSFVGRLDVELTGSGVADVRHHLIHVNASIPSDDEMHRAVEQVLAPHRRMLSEVVGQTETALNRNTFLEATMDNLLLQAIAEAADTRIAFSNGWRYGAPIVPGPVTVNDLWNIVPPNPLVSLAALTGREMWEMIEENLEHTLANDPFRQMGGYVKRCLGVNLYIKVENPAGSRIQQFFVSGEGIEAQRCYTVAFITSQGVPKKYGSNRRELPISAIDALRRYSSNHPKVNADLRGTVVAV